ncbi:hypothetical protein [Methanosarcina barkeri]|uniref:hypothetical protein n=1 Tax=Methanosarcina barkeri TaxID=2208 RepID=UPI000B2A8FA6|nr:hypothetical protein [Methanosarcina barkeri]
MDKVFEVLNKTLEENSPVDCIVMSGDAQLLKEIQRYLPLNLEIIEKPSDLKLEKNGRGRDPPNGFKLQKVFIVSTENFSLRFQNS